MSAPRLHDSQTRLRLPAVVERIEDMEFILQLPERACGCHPAMPVERTPDGWACKGCGVHA